VQRGGFRRRGQAFKDSGVLLGKLPQIWQRVAQKVPFPGVVWPASRRVHAVGLAVLESEHRIRALTPTC
jgi:hypothetical protein